MSIIMPGRDAPIELNVTNLHGKIVIQFSRDIAELVLEPQEAAELARAIAQITRAVVERNHS